LRAVGARSKDVFGIFFSESFIIATINWLIAMTLTIGVVIFLNNYLRTTYGILITLLDVGIRQVGLVFATSIGVAFIASLLPVSKIAHKKPIDAIQNR
jgi:ABC-type lipoprotein release transport system permease subunit